MTMSLLKLTNGETPNFVKRITVQRRDMWVQRISVLQKGSSSLSRSLVIFTFRREI